MNKSDKSGDAPRNDVSIESVQNVVRGKSVVIVYVRPVLWLHIPVLAMSLPPLVLRGIPWNRLTHLEISRIPLVRR